MSAGLHDPMHVRAMVPFLQPVNGHLCRVTDSGRDALMNNDLVEGIIPKS